MSNEKQSGKLIVTQGLPGSGKSTWAIEQLKNRGVTRVNRDIMRQMCFNDVCLDKRESFISTMQKAAVAAALRDGLTVIVDDTNLTAKYVKEWEDLATRNNSKFEIKSFLDVPIETCIARDSKRKGHERVGSAVIYMMALRAGLIDLTKLDKIAIVDLDGTTYDITHRQHFVGNSDKSLNNWPAFWAGIPGDTVRQDVLEMIHVLKAEGHFVILLSGREALACAALSDDKLTADNVPHDMFLMRRAKDNRPDEIIKAEILRLLPKEKIKHIIDDRPKVVRMWQAEFAGTDTVITDVGDGVEF